MTGLIRRDYRTLDAIVVVGCMVMAYSFGLALVFTTIPQAQLAILSALVSGPVCGALGLYAGARWGNKKPDADA